MPGRPPKDPSERINRVKPRDGEWQVLPGWEYEGPVPDAPDGLTKESLAKWESWWASPMAHMWDAADHGGVVDVIRMSDDARTAADRERVARVAGLYGLTPRGRQLLRWRLPDTGAVEMVKGPKADKRRRADVIRLLADES